MEGRKSLDQTQFPYYFRSKIRRKRHLSIFSSPPETGFHIPELIKNNKRFISILGELTASKAVINKVFHWTTEDNFKKILETKHIYGNESLKIKNIPFQANALSPADEKNGDGNVICLCPYLVDPLAFYDNKTHSIKKNILRLTCDPDKPIAKGKYNQFFKLYDFQSPDFEYVFCINKELNISIRKSSFGPDYKLTYLSIDFKDKNETILLFHSYGETAQLEKNECIYYGNIYGINYFCLSKLFNLLQKAKDKTFVINFIEYLDSLDNKEIKKILTTFAQGLTIFAEYNFYAALPLVDRLITEVHFVESSKTLSLAAVSTADYAAKLASIFSETNLLPAKTETFIKESSPSSSLTAWGASVQNHHILLYGNNFTFSEYGDRRVDVSMDFSGLDASLFDGEYYETRPNLVGQCVMPEHTPTPSCYK